MLPVEEDEEATGPGRRSTSDAGQPATQLGSDDEVTLIQGSTWSRVVRVSTRVTTKKSSTTRVAIAGTRRTTSRKAS